MHDDHEHVEQRAQELVAHLQAVFDFPIAVVDSRGAIICRSVVGHLPSIQNAIAALASIREDELSFHYHARVCSTISVSHTETYRVIAFTPHADSYSAYIDALARFIIQGAQLRTEPLLLGPRTILTNQLAHTEGFSSETDTLIGDLNLTMVPRCALVISFKYSTVDSSRFDFLMIENQIATIVREYSASKEDIYGLINIEQFLLFKHIETAGPLHQSPELCTMLTHLVQDLEVQTKAEVRITIGSNCLNFSDLKRSYREAMFLHAHFDYLHTKGSENFLFLSSYIFEYLVSTLPPHHLGRQFKHYTTIMDNKKNLLETISSLTKNNTVLTAAAQDLNIHRNTVLNRYATLRQTLSLDPLYCDTDRANLRAFSLHSNKRITLQAGVVIQPNSVLHRGMQRLVQLIEQKSKGVILLNLHTLSMSGNNKLLFDLVSRNALDLAVLASSVLNEATSNRSKILELPFLFQSYNQAREILNTKFKDIINSSLSSGGIRCLGFWSMGWRYITSQESPVLVPADLKNRKIRIMHNDTISRYFEMMGATPIKMHYGDVIKALQSGIVDSQENPYNNTLEMGFFKYQQFITQLKYNLSTESCIISKARWDSLGAEHQDIISSAMEETTEWIFKEQQQFNQKCKRILIEDHGMQLLTPTLREEQQWRAHSLPLYKEYPHKDLLKLFSATRSGG